METVHSEQLIMEPQPKETGHWQCRACSSRRVEDRLLGMVGENTEVRRLKCTECGVMNYYDRKRGQPLVRSAEKFLWIPEIG